MADAANTMGAKDEALTLHKEREEIRNRIGAIGGKSRRKVDRIVNLSFLAIVVTLFVLEVGFGLVPALISLEIAVLLVSVKVIIVMTSLQRVSHYEFWILNTIDFRISQLENSVECIRQNREPGTASDSPDEG